MDKNFDGRIKKLPYYCPKHHSYGRYYVNNCHDFISGFNRPKVLTFNMPLCNYAECNCLLAPYDPNLEDPTIRTGHSKPYINEANL